MIQVFWAKLTKNFENPLPKFVDPDDDFGVTNLKKIFDSGSEEFLSTDSRYTIRKTYAFRIGYHGIMLITKFILRI